MVAIDIFVDEAGDLGFTDKSTKYFVLGYMTSDCPLRVAALVKRLQKTLNVRKHKKINEFKFRNDSDETRNKVLNLITSLDLKAGKMVINKERVNDDLRKNKAILYNYVIAEYIVSDIINFHPEVTHINLHLDRSMSAKSITLFNAYFARKIDWKATMGGVDKPVTHKVFHDYSHQEPCIQVADYIAGSVFRSYAMKETQYFEVIEKKFAYSHGWGA